MSTLTLRFWITLCSLPVALRLHNSIRWFIQPIFLFHYFSSPWVKVTFGSQPSVFWILVMSVMLCFISPLRGLVWTGSIFPLICIILLASSFIVMATRACGGYVEDLSCCLFAFCCENAGFYHIVHTHAKSLGCVPSPWINRVFTFFYFLREYGYYFGVLIFPSLSRTVYVEGSKHSQLCNKQKIIGWRSYLSVL